MGRHLGILGIDFLAILLDFGSQVARQNGAKIDPKMHRKNDGKKKGTKMAKKSLHERVKHRDREFPGPWGG